MEELRKLESLQRTLTFMESRSFVSSSADSNRFFANLIVLLLQPCGQLNLNTKCTLLSEYIPKISVKFLEEALEWVGLENGDKDSEENFVHLNNPPDDKTDFSSCQINHEGLAMVGLESMERANSTLEDFCRSYFMFHGMDIDSPQAVFKYLPVLSFTESYIYQLDALNEKILYIPTGVTTVAKKLEKVEYHNFATNVFEENPFKPLLNILDSRGLLTERIKEELRSGEEYWALERKLCCALVHKTEISTEDVMRAIHLKSFDYRVLNLLLYKLRGEEVNDLHMEFLSVSEFLVEISDDLFDYEDDVLENNFNILRMFVKIYGPITTPAMLARYISNAEDKYDKLLKTLDPQLSSKYQRRCEEATKEGGKVSGHPLGTWNIPPVIINEDLYRSNCLNTE